MKAASRRQREFVSYPKSGRSWIRFILARLNLLESVRFHHDQFEFNDPAQPPHNFDLARRLERYAQIGKVVYLERDPRDVMVSLFFQVTGRFRDFFHYRGKLPEFIRDDYFGAKNLQHFREMWAEIASCYRFLTVSYENCHADPNQVMRQILNYYEFDVASSELEDAVSHSTFEKMKNLEESGTFAQPWLQLRNGAPKMRRGQVGGYRDYLDQESLAYLNELFGCD